MSDCKASLALRQPIPTMPVDDTGLASWMAYVWNIHDNDRRPVAAEAARQLPQSECVTAAIDAAVAEISQVAA